MKAADVRRDAVWQNLQSQEASHPFGAYHRRCYQTYTHKKALDRIRKCRDSQAEASISDDASMLDKAADSQVQCTRAGSEHAVSTRKSLRSVSVTVSLDACLFCGQKRWKHRKRKRESEPLSECMTFQAALAITEAANARQDERILRELQARPYAIASELRYHRSCYAAYTDKRSIQSILEKRVAEEDAGAEEQGSPFQRAFCHLKAEVEKIKLMLQLV